MSRRYVLLGNPRNRRVALFQAALAKRGLAPARVLGWDAFLDAPQALGALLQPGDVLRLDSPGESFAVEQRLLRWGLETTPASATRLPHPEALEEDHGRIRAPAQYFAGLCAALAEVERQLEGAGVLCLNPPQDVRLLFDKAGCHGLLSRCGLPVPPALPPVDSYEALCREMAQRGWSRVFVKLNTGSSASGVVALQRARGRVLATTSVEVAEGGRLYNSLRVRRYEDERTVAALLDTLAAEGVHVERWIPKVTVEGRVTDVRVVAIAGRACHAVARTSPGPLTNLHLGNARGRMEAVRHKVGEAAWDAVLATVREVADVFPRSLHLGVDVLLAAHTHAPLVAEVNAFGDLLPNVEVLGRSTYEEEVDAVERGDFPRQPRLRAALFDLDNTLIDRDGALRSLLLARAAARGCPAEAVERAFVEGNGHGHAPREALCRQLVAQVPGLADSAEALEEEIAQGLAGHVPATPRVAEALHALRAHLWVGVVTDGGAALQRAKLVAAGLGALPAVISAEVGAEKPAPQMFLTALGQAGCQPQEALFVGDHPVRDIGGAAALGMRTCWISRGQRQLPTPRPDWVCPSLDAALERVSRWT